MSSNEKRINTNISLYNVDNVSKIAEVQEKRRKTFEAKRTQLVFNKTPILYTLRGQDLTVFQLYKDVSDAWLDKYHPLGAPRGAALSLGLVKDNVIYCIMAFKQARNKQYKIELCRMWTLPGCYVEDGYDILSKYASDYGLHSIVAYVNTTFESYKEYEAIGMHRVREMQRTKWWINFNSAMTDASRRQRKIEEEKLLQSGWIPVYDKGQLVYVVE